MNRTISGGIHLRAAIALCAVTVLLASCGSNSPAPANASSGIYVATATQWSSAHPGPVYTTISSLAPDTGTVRWQHREQWSPYHGAVGQPVVARDVVYVIADTNTTSTDPAHPLSGLLLALRASDGKQLWRAEVGAIASKPVLDGDTIYISAEHVVGKSGFTKEIYALNRDDGSVRWKTEISNTRTISDTLMLSQGRLFLSANQLCFDSCSAAYLFALDTGSGHIIWQRSFEGNVTIQSPKADGDVVYVQIPGYGTGFFALSAVDGHQLWQDSGGTYFASGGVVYKDRVISAPDPYRNDRWKYAVVALDGKTGMKRWQTPTSIYPAVQAIVGGQVIVRSEVPNPQSSQSTSPYFDMLAALNASDGKQLWSAQQNAYETGIASAGETLYLALPPTHTSGQHQVAALHAADGAVLWRQPVGPANAQLGSGPGDFGIADATDKLFCVVSAGILYGVRTTDGHTLWNKDLSASGQIGGITIAT